MNVLFFMTDQHHADALSYVGHPMVRTPHLDALAARSSVFHRAYTCSAICSPSRTSFFTGAYLRTHGHVCNEGGMNRTLPSLVGELRRNGYHTAQCGKNHLPDAITAEFDELHLEHDLQAQRRDAGLPPEPKDPRTASEFLSYTMTGPESLTPEVWTADRAIDILQRSHDQQRKFFLWCSFSQPHCPHAPPEAFDDLYDPSDVEIDWEAFERFEDSKTHNRAMIESFWNVGSARRDPDIFRKAVCRYLALVTLIDREIGRVLRELERLGLRDDTIVAFTSDHGDFAGRYGQLGKNVPGYEDLLRIPLIYDDPTRRGDLGRGVYGMVQSIDLMPTLLHRLDVPVPPTVQGRDLTPVMDGRPDAARECIFAETATVKTIRTAQWKLNFDATRPDRSQLFSMFPRIDEITNLWHDPAHRETKLRLVEQLTAWMAHCEQPIGIEPLAESFPDTRWHNWLLEQPTHTADDQLRLERGEPCDHQEISATTQPHLAALDLLPHSSSTRTET